MMLVTAKTMISVFLASVLVSAFAGSSALDGKECVYPTWECAASDPSLTSTEYHLSPTGDDDAGDGSTPSSAWQTPSRALRAAATDCGEVVVHLMTGNYGSGVGIDVSLKDSKEFAAREDLCGPGAGWVTFLGPGGGTAAAELSHVLISGVPNAKVAVRSIGIVGTHPGSSNDNNAVNVKTASQIRLDEVTIDPSADPLWTDYSAMPQGINTRDASDLVVTRSSIIGGRYGAVLRGTDLHVLDSDIGYQFADSVRIVSAISVTVENCLIHDVADYQGTGEHLDGIQFFAAGPAGSYPQPRDVVLRGNTFRNMAGQMIFVQSNYVDIIGNIENVLIENNVLEKKAVDDASRPVQIQGVKNFGFEGNTVDGDVLIRWESEGYVRDNLIGRLMVQTDSVLVGGGPTDHNVLGSYLTESTTSDVEVGPNSIVDPDALLYADPEVGDYTPRSIEACAGASDGLHAGAIPCDVCSGDRWWAPGAPDDPRAAALFNALPPRVPLGQSAELVASASVSCVGSALTKWIWSTSDGQSFDAPSPYSSVLLSSAGSHEVTLIVEDEDGGTSPPLTRTVVVEAPPEPGLVASYPFSAEDMADVSPANHEAATYVGASGGTTVNLVPSSCPGTDAVSLDGTDYLQLPTSVRDSVNNLPSLTVSIFARPLSPRQLFYKHVTVGIRVDAARVYCNVGTSSNGWWPEIKALVPGGTHMDGGWHHFAVTYDSVRGEVGCYLDGALVGTKESRDEVKSGSWPMTVGVISHKLSSSILTGDVGGFKVYDRALEAEEIAELSSAGMCGAARSLLQYILL